MLIRATIRVMEGGSIIHHVAVMLKEEVVGVGEVILMVEGDREVGEEGGANKKSLYNKIEALNIVNH